MTTGLPSSPPFTAWEEPASYCSIIKRGSHEVYRLSLSEWYWFIKLLDLKRQPVVLWLDFNCLLLNLWVVCWFWFYGYGYGKRCQSALLYLRIFSTSVHPSHLHLRILWNKNTQQLSCKKYLLGTPSKKKSAKLHTWPKEEGGRSFQMQTFFREKVCN